MDKLKAPFPWFGGKSRVAAEVWARFGEVKNYVEPFAGSLAVLLGRPHAPGIETVNDLDGYVANFWRAMTKDPEAVAAFADWPVNECDLHARHIWLVNQKERFVPRLMGDPDFYDAKIAGWWVWGLCSWIGGGWCSGDGPWVSVDGELVKREGAGVHRKRPHLGNAGQGINRQRPHLGNARGSDSRRYWIECLTDRLSGVRVVCGDWTRVCGGNWQDKIGICGMFFDPPYGVADRDTSVYHHDSTTVAADVMEWVRARGNNPRYRIVLAGYEEYMSLVDEHGWSCENWKAQGGYAGTQRKEGSTAIGKDNAKREMLYYSPHCLGAADPADGGLFST